MLKRFTDPKISMLSRIAVLQGATRPQLRALCAQTTQVEFETGSALCTQGHSGREMFLLVSGEVSVECDGEVVATLGAGEVVGEISMISRRPRTATVRALTPVTALVLNRRELDALSEVYDLAAERIDVTGVRRTRELVSR